MEVDIGRIISGPQKEAFAENCKFSHVLLGPWTYSLMNLISQIKGGVPFSIQLVVPELYFLGARLPVPHSLESCIPCTPHTWLRVQKS